MKKQRLLVSIRGSVEAIAAAKGGADIADVEYPASALGTPYPLNVFAVRTRLNKAGFRRIMVSTNIGEVQSIRATACQAALGVAVAGADLIKFGLAEQSPDAAQYLASSIIRTVRRLAPEGRRLFPAVFVDEYMTRFFDPFRDGPRLVAETNADGLLIDTFNKSIGKGLLDFCSVKDIARFTKALHAIHKEAWIAGSISLEELPALWSTGVDVICVRGAACEEQKGRGRFGAVTTGKVKELADTMASARSIPTQGRSHAYGAKEVARR